MGYQNAERVLPSELIKMILDYQKGMSMEMLADKYFLSLKSIQRIIYTSD